MYTVVLICTGRSDGFAATVSYYIISLICDMFNNRRSWVPVQCSAFSYIHIFISKQWKGSSSHFKRRLLLQRFRVHMDEGLIRIILRVCTHYSLHDKLWWAYWRGYIFIWLFMVHYSIKDVHLLCVVYKVLYWFDGVFIRDEMWSPYASWWRS